MPRGKKAGRTFIKSPKETISEYERQLRVDDGIKMLWFKHVLSKEETLELIKFYCHRIKDWHNVADPGVYDLLLKDIGRVLFLAKNMDHRK